MPLLMSFTHCNSLLIPVMWSSQEIKWNSTVCACARMWRMGTFNKPVALLVGPLWPDTLKRLLECSVSLSRTRQQQKSTRGREMCRLGYYVLFVLLWEQTARKFIVCQILIKLIDFMKFQSLLVRWKVFPLHLVWSQFNAADPLTASVSTKF
jgi:hypothetical protein